MERFAKVYEYPYGSSYLSSYLYEPGRLLTENAYFERNLKREREMKPFHIDCDFTGRKVCFCTKSEAYKIQKLDKDGILSLKFRHMAYELQMFYEGYPDGILQR